MNLTCCMNSPESKTMLVRNAHCQQHRCYEDLDQVFKNIKYNLQLVQRLSLPP
jgi:hypothetical protein